MNAPAPTLDAALTYLGAYAAKATEGDRHHRVALLPEAIADATAAAARLNEQGHRVEVTLTPALVRVDFYGATGPTAPGLARAEVQLRRRLHTALLTIDETDRGWEAGVATFYGTRNRGRVVEAVLEKVFSCAEDARDWANATYAGMVARGWVRER